MTATAMALVRGRPFDAREEERRYREFRRGIQPFIDAKIKFVYNVTMPELVVYPDGRMTQTYRFTEAQQAFLSCMDDVIDAVKLQYYPAGSRA